MDGLILYIFSGLVGVSNMIIWGLYGDLNAEKFKLIKVFRSVLLGVFYGSFIYFLNNNLPLLVVAFSVISLERITTEIYKALIRNEDQSKYKIPSDLNFKFSRVLKVILGLTLIFSILLLLRFVDLKINNLLLTVIAGIIAALGGMAKDAPYEGFELLKFFRTPIVSVVMGLLLNFYYPGLESKFFLLALMGGERVVSECWKKVIKGKVPGKFKKEINPEWRKKRKMLLVPYAISFGLFILLFLFDRGLL